MKRIALCFAVVGIAVSVWAEFRTWTDRNGNTLEAEFVGAAGTDIVLRKTDETQITLSPLLLSDQDLEYLKGKVPDDLIDPGKSALDRPKPPRLDIRISKNTNTLKRDNFVERDYTLVVKIRKRSLKPYAGQMTAELFLVGKHKEDEYLVMLDRTKVEFDFTESEEVELQGKKAHISYDQDWNVGIEYEGNVVVIRDEEGNVFDVVGSNKTFEKSHEGFAKFERDDVFTDYFKKKGTRSSLNDVKKNNRYL